MRQWLARPVFQEQLQREFYATHRGLTATLKTHHQGSRFFFLFETNISVERTYCNKSATNDTPQCYPQDPGATMPFARFLTCHSLKPPGRPRPAQSPGNQRGNDKQNECRNQCPIIPYFDAVH